MKFSEQWLREWSNPAIDSATLAAQITMAGLEVDGVAPVAGTFDKVVVASVVDTRSHPQADKLTLCEVDNGSERLQIVCGAANVRPGIKVALAQIGTVMPSGLKIKKSKLRGEMSFGMLCSASELGLTESSEGIMELPSDAPLGKDLREFLNLDDNSFDVDLTPNRADCFSVLGIAREVAVITKDTPPVYAPAKVQNTSEERLAVRIEAKEACTNYQCRLIQGIKPGVKSPLWLVERLRRSGLRSIHPVVDVTNFVMLECGQPMHAFDTDSLNGGIVVRYAKHQECLALLDEQQKTLEETVLVIADESRCIAMAGIMGGKESSVHEETQAILLESAWFHPRAIAGVARSYGLCTDSSQRFERGVDPCMQERALERATALILEICGGTAGPIASKTSVKHGLPATDILFKPESVLRVTGVVVEESEMRKTLSGLGLNIDAQDTHWTIRVPSWRFDLSSEVDLVEEIIRIHGYDNISGQALIAPVRSGFISRDESLAMRLSHFFVARGYHETISYSFVDPTLQEALYPNNIPLNLVNPISAELSQMRMGLWPGLLAALLRNTHRRQRSLKLFESGVRFNNTEQGLEEEAVFSGLISGSKALYHWGEADRAFDFYDAKGDVQAALASLGIDTLDFQPSQHPALHPGKSAVLSHKGVCIGRLGVLHPAFSEELELTSEVILFELVLDSIRQGHRKQYEPVSKYPAIRRDLSLLVKDSISAAQIESTIRSTFESPLLKRVDVFDVYYGDSVSKGYKSLAVSLEMQDSQKTLVDDEINNKISAILKRLEDSLSIKLRE